MIPNSEESTRCFIPPRDLPRAYGPAPARGRIKQHSDDFSVEELLGFEPEGEGPHAWLQIRKRDTNTRWLAGALARLAGVAGRDVGYAGLKDRAAVTTQWFSVPMEGRGSPDWGAIASEEVEVLRVTRHRKKLRRGVLAGNRFRIRVQGFEGDTQALESRVRELDASGVPNYFGEQRFGRDSGNVASAWEMLAEGKRVRDRDRRGLYLSAARAMLFNRVLARRVHEGSWRRALPGEALMLDGSHSVFKLAEPDADIDGRLVRMDLHPTGPMWGRGDPLASGEALALEEAALAGCAGWCDGLDAAGLESARRALRVPLAELSVVFEATDRLMVSFALPAGAYATMAMRELIDSDPV
ncbi:MAG: tRNA pseudouridine(13) synthase TruD [Gammaproteobacteria bacterium]